MGEGPLTVLVVKRLHDEVMGGSKTQENCTKYCTTTMLSQLKTTKRTSHTTNNCLRHHMAPL